MPDLPKTLFVAKRFRVEEVAQQLANGSVHRREIVRHAGSVAIIPLVEDEQVCLIRNFRVSVQKTLIELPAGTLEPPEEPALTAARELIEETGYRAARLRHLHSFYLAPGILDEQMHLYLATDLESVGTAREPGEEIENLIVPWRQAIQFVFDGTIQDAKTIVGLLYFNQLKSKEVSPCV